MLSLQAELEGIREHLLQTRVSSPRDMSSKAFNLWLKKMERLAAAGANLL